MSDSTTESLKKRLYELNKERVDGKFLKLDDRMDKLETKILEKDKCTQLPLFDSLQNQIKENSKMNKRMLTWQAGVGISLLLFFISVGLAWFRYVDKISYETDANKEKIQVIEDELESYKQKYLDSQKELKELLRQLINNNSS